MDKADFSFIRKALNKTQKQISELLGVSLKSVHSYEQGWRSIPVHIERQLYFFLTKQSGKNRLSEPCWERKSCTDKEECPAYEFQSGDLCWFFCGTRCNCGVDLNCKEKMAACRDCEVLLELMVNSKIKEPKV